MTHIIQWDIVHLRRIFSGKIMCDVVHWNPIQIRTCRNTPMNKDGGFVIIRLKQVIKVDLRMGIINETKKLPYKCNKKQLTRLGVIKIQKDDIDDMIEEVYRRDKFDRDFDITFISEYDNNKDSSSSEGENED